MCLFGFSEGPQLFLSWNQFSFGIGFYSIDLIFRGKSSTVDLILLSGSSLNWMHGVIFPIPFLDFIRLRDWSGFLALIFCGFSSSAIFVSQLDSNCTWSEEFHKGRGSEREYIIGLGNWTIGNQIFGFYAFILVLRIWRTNLSLIIWL